MKWKEFFYFRHRVVTTVRSHCLQHFLWLQFKSVLMSWLVLSKLSLSVLNKLSCFSLSLSCFEMRCAGVFLCNFLNKLLSVNQLLLYHVFQVMWSINIFFLEGCQEEEFLWNVQSFFSKADTFSSMNFYWIKFSVELMCKMPNCGYGNLGDRKSL